MKKRALRKLVRSGTQFLVPVKDKQDANRVLMKLRAVGAYDDYRWNRAQFKRLDNGLYWRVLVNDHYRDW